MPQAKKVTCIPATLTKFTSSPITTQVKRKVAGYARVSTDEKEQNNSYEAQVNYYTSYIKSKPEWDFVNVYTDDGISGTSTKHRDGFNSMITDALSGKIDLILTKSVSRFARNTVDSLTTIRSLKAKGVEVYFEKENIWTFDSKGEILLTIMSSLAQEESRSISENITWGIRKRFADGKVTVPYKAFLGYDKGPDGNLIVNEKEAQIVRNIYNSFYMGKSVYTIAKELTESGIPTPRGSKIWSQTTIYSILGNEKYTGNAILQKTYTQDFLTKKRKTNHGEVPMYYVENNHEAIISQELFDIVQVELKKHRRRNSVGLFSGKIICADCGSYYGPKVWHSTSKCRSVVWQCNNKFKNDKKCKTPHLKEEDIKAAFIKAVNNLPLGDKKALNSLRKKTDKAMDTTKLEVQLKQVESEMNTVSELAKKSIARPIKEAQSTYDKYASEFNNLQKKHSLLSDQIQDQKQQNSRIHKYYDELEQMNKLYTEFDENSFASLVERATVYKDGRIVFTFKDGMKI